MATTVADVMVATLRASGVRRVYGIPGDSVNGFTDAPVRVPLAGPGPEPRLAAAPAVRRCYRRQPRRAGRTILSGGGSELIELAKTNLRELEVE
jgi:phage terminase large subunit GpA-like protein